MSLQKKLLQFSPTFMVWKPMNNLHRWIPTDVKEFILLGMDNIKVFPNHTEPEHIKIPLGVAEVQPSPYPLLVLA